MTPFIFNKFNKFVFYPDLSNKFLLQSYYSILSPKNFDVYLKYVFKDHTLYNSTAIKALLMLNSITTARCQLSSRLILVKYAKNRCISSIYQKMNLNTLVPLFNVFIKKPTNMHITLTGFRKEATHFVFPGFIKRLRFPSWERSVLLSFKQPKTKNLYFLLFYKTAYLD
jgi:hypothetical protein